MRKKKEYKSFEEAREYVRSLGLIGTIGWQEYKNSSAKPDDIPLDPNRVYKDEGWKGFGDWLGTGRKKNEGKGFLPFEEAREYVRSLGIETQKDWMAYRASSQKPKNIPTAPDLTYKETGWRGLADWLGNGKLPKGEHRPFEEAREFVRSLGIANEFEWKRYCKSGQKPPDIPSYPNQVYEDKGWAGMGDWLRGFDARIKGFPPFEEAREFVRSLGLKGQREWKSYISSGQKPDYIPSSPHITYKGKGWAGYGYWLGSERKRYSKIKPFKEARKFARSLKIRNIEEWKEYSKSGQRPDGIPSAPDLTYKGKGWMGWKDWLGHKKIRRTKKLEGVL